MTKSDRVHITRYDVTDALGKLEAVHGQRFADYRRAWDETCKGRVASEYPLYIVIGVNSDCNLCCKMCVRHFDKEMNTKHVYMPLETIDKIVEQCRAIHVPSVLIGQEAECLLHPEIKEIIKRIKQIDPVDFLLITNGILLNEDMSKFLVEMEIDRLQISVDAASKETYKKIRGGSLEVLERNIHNFVQIRNALGKELPLLRLSFCVQPDNIHEKDDFLNKWSGIADIVDFQDLIDMSYIHCLADKAYREYHCPDPFQRLVIEYEGNIYGCCATGYNQRFRLGNLSDTSLLEAWGSPVIKELRDSFITQKLYRECLNCRANRGI